MSEVNSSVIDRFVRKTKKLPNGCIIWTGGKLRGYGSFNVNSKTCSAHRASYQLFRGLIPSGLFVLHDCPDGDNRLCVNPYHLWLGTGQDNMDDMVKKGRQNTPTGEQHPACKLTETDVEVIRLRCSMGETQQSVATDYGLNQSHVSRIVRGKKRRK